jgi:aminopeptidase N
MKKPMSSYLVMLAIGNFNKKTTISNSGILLENYYLPACENQFDYTYKSSDVIFNFLEKEIGMKYPWEIYRQIPVRDFLYGGMENTTSTIFAQDYFVDESGFNDKNYVNVNAHELAHQWFGNVVTAKEGKHHWLQEGFATYFALLAEREVFGEDYFYNSLYHNSLQLRSIEKSDSIPILNEKASSLTFYQKGAWSLHFIRESIGEKKFRKAVKNYLKKYKFKNVETSNFLNEISKISDFDVNTFQKNWLENPKFPTAEATVLLKKNRFMQQLFEIQKAKNLPQIEKFDLFLKVLKSDCYYPIKVEIVNQLRSVPFEDKKELLLAAMQTNDIKVRLAVANSFKTIPIDFQADYETLLLDKSNNTKEIALQKLYESFPEKQDFYLEISSKWVGNNDKNLRILYLFLKEISQKGDPQSLQELIHYTSADFESSIRMNAFDYCLQLENIDDEILINLVNATQHFKWQVNGFARNAIRKLIKACI